MKASIGAGSWIFTLITAIITMGCSNSMDGVCDPGATHICHCGGGQTGVQICKKDGKGWGICEKCTTQQDRGTNTKFDVGPKTQMDGNTVKSDLFASDMVVQSKAVLEINGEQLYSTTNTGFLCYTITNKGSVTPSNLYLKCSLFSSAGILLRDCNGCADSNWSKVLKPGSSKSFAYLSIGYDYGFDYLLVNVKWSENGSQFSKDIKVKASQFVTVTKFMGKCNF